MTTTKSRFQFRERFFFLLVLPVAYTVEWAFAVTHDWQAYPRSEWVALMIFVYLFRWYIFCFSQARWRREHG